jgi:hypothetical protein
VVSTVEVEAENGIEAEVEGQRARFDADNAYTTKMKSAHVWYKVKEEGAA